MQKPDNSKRQDENIICPKCGNTATYKIDDMTITVFCKKQTCNTPIRIK